MKNQIKIESPIKPFKKQIEVSSDKSLSIRCILLSSIALGRSKIFNLLESEDVNKGDLGSRQADCVSCDG